PSAPSCKRAKPWRRQRPECSRALSGSTSRSAGYPGDSSLAALRGLETTYYQLGSDYRGNLTYLLSYMSQMGGWSILDYALRFATDPTDYLRLGYASSLSSWALVNSGTPETNYGYWFPGKANDGAAGGGFMPDAIGRAWIGKEMPRGAWHYSAEEDVGYAGALRSSATIVAREST
ncbi:MAG TPA: hypothetical protein VFJ02_24275, partial [Vicinamibacterales bacterium]|nr:hypothetical protein [Vicinamibacterales bacterium]